MRIVFIFIINYNLKGEIKMGEITNYFNEKLDTLVNNVNDNDYKNVLESNYSGNKEMNELKNLFKEKLTQAQNFEGIIKKVDQNIEMLYKAQENMNKNMDKNKQTSLQQAVLQEIDYFQNISKPSCLSTIGTLRGKLTELKKEVTSQEKKLDEIRKDNKKSTGKRILNFFGLSKTKDEATKKKEEENTQNKKLLKQQLENLKKEITNTSQKLQNSRSTLSNFKLVSKSAKDFQQKNFGIMTKKSVMNAIYNEKKGTGMIGCLSKVYEFLRQQYRDSIFPKSKPPGAAFRELKKNTSNQRKQQPKYDKTKIKHMKNMLTDKEPKHFIECKRKLDEFSQLVLSENLLNGKNLGENKFDIGEFNSLKDKLMHNMGDMFKNISSMMTTAVGNYLTYSNNGQDTAKILNTSAKKIYKEKDKLIKEYTKLKNQFMKDVKNLFPKMKNRYELAQGLAALAFFNCIHSRDLEVKYQELFNDTNANTALLDEAKETTILLIFSSSIVWVICTFIFVLTLVTLYPIAILLAVLPIATCLYTYSIAPMTMYYMTKLLNRNDDLDAITGAIIEQSKAAKQ